jgi:hypothetical protein
MKNTSLLIICLCSSFIWSQSIVLKGIVLDEHKNGIENVHISENNQSKHAVSNRKGEFVIVLKDSTYSLVLSHVSYIPKKISGKLSDGGIFSVSLKQSLTELNAVTVEKQNFTLLDGNENKHIYDYELDRNLIYLTTEIDKKNYLEVWSDDLDNKHKLELSFEPKSMEKDCMGNIHILSKENAYQVYLRHDRIRLMSPVPLKEYDQFLRPCVAETDSFMVFSSVNENTKEQFYYSINKNNADFGMVYMIADSAQRISYSEFVTETKAHPGNYINPMGDLSQKQNGSRKQAMQKAWLIKYHLKPTKYNPVFLNDSGLVVLNHVFDSVLHFSEENLSYIKRAGISYHEDKDFNHQVLQDEFKDKLHPVYKGSRFIEIGELDNQCKIVKRTPIKSHVFPEEIKIHRGFAYYLSRKNKEFSPYVELVRVAI